MNRQREYLDLYQTGMNESTNEYGSMGVLQALECGSSNYDGLDSLDLDDGFDYSAEQPPITIR